MSAIVRMMIDCCLQIQQHLRIQQQTLDGRSGSNQDPTGPSTKDTFLDAISNLAHLTQEAHTICKESEGLKAKLAAAEAEPISLQVSNILQLQHPQSLCEHRHPG